MKALSIAMFVFGMLIAACSGGDDTDTNDPTAVPTNTRVSETSSTVAPDPTPTVEVVVPTEIPSPTVEVPASPIATEGEDRFLIPSVSIDVPLITFKVTELDDGALPQPEESDAATLYDVSDFGFDAVFGEGIELVSGHIVSDVPPCEVTTDPPPCAAAMWSLTDVVVGDEILVRYDKEVYRYMITSAEEVVFAETDQDFWNAFYAPGDKPTMALWVNAGEFVQVDEDGGYYLNRFVVRAELAETFK